MKDQLKEYRTEFAKGDYLKAQDLLKKSELAEDKRSLLLFKIESGTVALALQNYDDAIYHFQASLGLIDELYTKRLSAKAASLLVNDASDVFYGASYERSYAHYFLAKSLYARYQKSGNKLDLQGARGTILAWDSYFAELQRSASIKTLYQTDLMLKIFGGQIHEVSEIRNDKQIALQLYKDALKILDSLGGVFKLFNTKTDDYIKAYEKALKNNEAAPVKEFAKTAGYEDLKDYLQYRILDLTKEIRGGEFQALVKSMKPSAEVLKQIDKKSNVVIVVEEGLIPQKVGKNFNIGLKGAMDAVQNPAAKAFIATTGRDMIALFAMNTLGMGPSATTGPGGFIFGYEATKLAVQEAAIEFELPMIEEVPLVGRMEVFILDEAGKVLKRAPLPVISDNGDIARVVLEEDAVSRYVKTGTRVAIKQIVAVIAAMQIYNRLKSNDGQANIFAKPAAMAAYVGASKGIAAMEKADTRHWTTLPQALRMMEFDLKPGTYQVAIGQYNGEVAPVTPGKTLGIIQVKDSVKSIHTFKFINP